MKAPQLIVAEPPPAYAVRAPLVVDSSLICALLFDEPERDEALHRMSGRTLYAPNVLDHEVVGVALRKHEQGWPAASLALAVADYASYEIELHAADPAQQLAIAQAYDVSSHDAAYLWLAARLKAPLATFDHRLGAAAQRHLSSLE